MKIRLLSVGRDRSGLFEPAVREYEKRLSRYVKFELVEVPESKREGDRGRDEEADALLHKLGDRERLWLLDEHGKELDSRGLSELLARTLSEGRDLALAIGGASGHGASIRAKAERSLSLSKLTLPHRLARVVAAEQLYRAFTLLRGEPYHRD
ncbi:MAG: 23S rRNA (pseudouridine(1915)-N(3))-methyltransferase RlmH [Deltaproteobacteria bacterium]|nr:23S rRNA (pseudouridine(1915)-N(3))-methyltransferase RlmH [Deltaproteobacteria bacterium]